MKEPVRLTIRPGDREMLRWVSRAIGEGIKADGWPRGALEFAISGDLPEKLSGKTMLDLLEPQCRELALPEADGAAYRLEMVSIAISLRRIADALEAVDG